jgi:hypothetical protein
MFSCPLVQLKNDTLSDGPIETWNVSIDAITTPDPGFA